jgi:peptidoglycan hydrolase-like protein with peptidoglycan-binding domain
VIADVQGVLQQMGYYKGEVDGLLGPLTREALTAYQADQGLTHDSGDRRADARFSRDELIMKGRERRAEI